VRIPGRKRRQERQAAPRDCGSIFLTKQPMVQEAPDLCHQKALTDFKGETAVPIRMLSVAGSDAHPSCKRESFKHPSE
jgi:hypothetical protein